YKVKHEYDYYKKVYDDKNGIFLSPYRYKTRMDSFRGILLRIPKDKKVYQLYKEIIEKFGRTIVLPCGERSKNLKTIKKIYSQLLEYYADRKTIIVGVGGGVICDIAGFIAGTFKRGTRLILIPTTLLAQIDASIGGKNGVNLGNFKNMIGTFYHPEKIIIDPKFLKTLDKRNFNNGTAEIIKSAVIYDSDLFKMIKTKPLSNFTDTELEEVIKKTINIKADIVQKDPNESGLRKILNFGHSFGHAIELTNHKLLHGEAVSIGMILACKLSEKLTGLSNSVTYKLEKILKLNSLPVRLPDCIITDELIDSVNQDKKRTGKSLDIVLLKNVGESVIYQIKLKEIKGLINDIR
ncbi:MAG: 3-dehydroquinate synthase, partial [Candidatus Delongbacteria bacterium]|nr:3-dehydroquinate synthase [Candidatus Delongbacteria bacterium]MCG2759697.1 3-dehydroquinate synthase [Candidatus Delongbacteria bacterium]